MRVRSMLALLATVSAIVGVTGAGAIGTAAKRPFTVKSTLAAKTVLPHRIQWIAHPRLAAEGVAAVDFLIDGKLRWVEHETPYIFSGADGTGYLVTSWLTPGRHRFTIRVTAVDGRRASETVVARVLPAPEPPAQLKGTWERTIDTSTAPKPGTAGNPTDTFTPSGTYRLVFEKRWIEDRFPGKFVLPQSNNTGEGLVNDSDWNPGPTSFHVQGAVMFHPFSQNLREGPWCFFGGPPAEYRWSVNGDTLTLAPIGGHDACGIRGFIWTGDWRRVP